MVYRPYSISNLKVVGVPATYKLDRVEKFSTSERSLFSAVADLKRTPIQWSAYKGMEVFDIFSRISYPYRLHKDILLKEGYGSELLLFAISMDAYIECKYYLQPSQIIYLATIGPRGAKILKQLRKAAFVKKICGVFFSDESFEPEVERLMPPHLDDIDSIFNYRYLPMWEEEVEDLVEYSYIPIRTNDEVITLFRETLSGLLKGIKPEKEDRSLEILLQSSRSKSLESGKKIFNFERSQKSLSPKNFSQEIGTCQRAIIPVYPGGFRDTVILEWRALNTVKYIEDRVRRILKNLPNQNYTDGAEFFVKSVKRFLRNSGTFVCRDIKKEGLTKPRYLLKIMLEELSKIDDNLLPFINFYESFEIEGFEKPKRGHGQGMANSLTTIMQITICEMVNSILAERGFNETVRSLNYNDDNVSLVPTEILDEFWDIEGYIMDGLGILRSDQKSFHSTQGFIYCEMYMSPFYPKLNDKNVVQRRNMLYTLLWEYPHEAKEYLSSMGNNPFYLDYIEEIILHFGYEFSPYEIELPLELGGWQQDKILSYSTALVDDDWQFNLLTYKIYMGSRIKDVRIPLPKRVLSRKKDKRSLYENLFPGYSEQLKEFLPAGKYKDLFYKFKLYREDPKLNAQYRKYLYSTRQREYQKRRDIIPSYSEFKQELLNSGKFIFPRGEARFKDPEFFSMKIERNPYLQDTPIENYLAYIGCIDQTKSPFREKFSIKASSFSWGLRKDEIFFWDPIYERFDFEGIPFESESFYSVDSRIEDTSSFLLAHYIIHGQVPVLPDSMNILIEKREVYQGFLSLEDFIGMSCSQYDRWEFSFFKILNSLLERSEIEVDLSNLVREIISERVEEDENPSIASSDSESELDYEENYRQVQLLLHKQEPLTPDDLQAILLGRKSPDNFPYSNILSDVVYSVIKFYRWSDSIVKTESRQDYIIRCFEKFLNVPELKQLLIQTCEEGYLVELGEALGVFTPSDSLDDLGIDLFD